MFIYIRKVKKYINENKKKLNGKDNNNEIKNFGKWIGTQQLNCNKNKVNIIKDKNIKTIGGICNIRKI